MALFRSRLPIAVVSLAVTAMTTAPLAAAELPRIAGAGPAGYERVSENAYGYRRHRHRDRVDAGDVIAGVAIIGVLAAIAGAASNNDDGRRTQQEPYREPYRDPSRQTRGWNSNGIETAVEMCVSQLERGNDRVESVDEASRDASGWNVAGVLNNGENFTCRIDNEGRIRMLDIGSDYGGRDVSYGDAGGPQLTDDAYARARARTGSTASPRYGVDGDIAPAGQNDPRPAYPGGPLPGEPGYEDSWGG